MACFKGNQLDIGVLQPPLFRQDGQIAVSVPICAVNISSHNGPSPTKLCTSLNTLLVYTCANFQFNPLRNEYTAACALALEKQCTR